MIKCRAEDFQPFRALCEVLFGGFQSSVLLVSIKDDASSVISTRGVWAKLLEQLFCSYNTSLAIYRKEDFFTLNGAEILTQHQL